MSSSNRKLSGVPLRAVDNAPSTPFVDVARPATTSFSIKLLSVYVFLVISRVLDVLPFSFLHIPMILLIALIIALIQSGELRTAFSSNVSRCLAAFTVWVVFCLPLSSWRAASVPSVESALQSFALFLIIAQLLRTEAEWRKVTGAYAYAVLVASILSFFLGREIGGRISLVNGSLADPNEFALILIVGLPFWWLKANRAGGFRKVFYFFCTVPIFVVFARTGSRSGLVALCTLFLIVMLFASFGQKLLIGALMTVVFVAAMAFLPDYLKVRFTTVFRPHTSEQLDAETQERLGGDIGSSEGREMLLLQSVQMTFEHPLFGVGPGVFASASWDERKKNGMATGLALVSHNTYTQISSETGIPGFILFVAALFFSVKYAFSDYRAARRAGSDAAKNGFYLFASLCALSVGIFFLSVGYTATPAVLIALAAALHKILKESLASQPQALPSPPAPSWQAAKTQSSSPYPVISRPPRPRLRRDRRSNREASRDLPLSKRGS